MKKYLRVFIGFISILFWSCGSSSNGGGGTTPTPVEPAVSELIKKSWSASLVQWDNVTQFDKSSSTNVTQGYAQFKLDLSTGSTVTLTEFDKRVFTGTYLLSSDNSQLTLKNLTSAEGAPSGTDGTIVFTINPKPTSSKLVLETTAAYIKAGNKVVKLTLVNP
ncbi:hypothetical protein V7S76_00280 [Aquirufa sp. ROCK2-A2]